MNRAAPLILDIMEVKFLYVDFSHANKEMASEMTK
jgi:hypothetical protein